MQHPVNLGTWQLLRVEWMPAPQLFAINHMKLMNSYWNSIKSTEQLVW